MRITPDCLIVVADGQNANFLQNRDSGDGLRLGSVYEMTLANEASRALGTDRPGHMQLGASTRKGSYEQADLHQENERRFLKQVAAKAQELFRSGAYRRVALLAEPRALGILRQEIGPVLAGACLLEMARDYTKTALPDLEKVLAAHEG